jgi:hypothetical protein
MHITESELEKLIKDLLKIYFIYVAKEDSQKVDDYLKNLTLFTKQTPIFTQTKSIPIHCYIQKKEVSSASFKTRFILKGSCKIKRYYKNGTDDETSWKIATHPNQIPFNSNSNLYANVRSKGWYRKKVNSLRLIELIL